MLVDSKLDETIHHPQSDTDRTAFPSWADAPLAEPVAPETRFPAMLDLGELTDPDVDHGEDPEGLHLPPPGLHATGSQLRRRLVTPESIAELQASEKPSLIQRILRRK